jgi:hypothetical protein
MKRAPSRAFRRGTAASVRAAPNQKPGQQLFSTALPCTPCAVDRTSLCQSVFTRPSPDSDIATYSYPDAPAAQRRPEADLCCQKGRHPHPQANAGRDRYQGPRARAPVTAENRERSAQVDHGPCRARGRSGCLRLPAHAADRSSSRHRRGDPDGRQPNGLRLAEVLCGSPLAWDGQRSLIGTLRQSADCSCSQPTAVFRDASLLAR